MKLIVGLGNPGRECEESRHNTGWSVIDYLLLTINHLSKWKLEGRFKAEAARAKWLGEDVILVKPQTFMNSSGEAVAKVANFYKVKPKDILLIHDDLDIPLGEFKLQQGRGPKCHLGVLSVEKKLGTKTFWRLRVGIANGGSGNEYVMAKFGQEEMAVLKKITPQILERIEGWVVGLSARNRV